MPKKPQATAPKLMTPRQLSRWQKERQRQRAVAGIGFLIVIIIAVVLGYGFYSSRLAPRWQAAIRVNDTTFNHQYVVNYVRAALGPQRANAEAVNSLASALVQQIQENELIKRAAAEFNISVSDEEINQAILESLAGPEGKDKVDEAQFQQRYQEVLANLKVSDAFLREFIASSLRRQKLYEHLEKQVPAQAEQVKLQAILLDTEEAAKDGRAQLEKGADFAALAKQLSKDEPTKEKGGEMGWVPRGLYPELDEAAFSLSPGTFSQPIATSQGYYILMVTERQDSMPVAEETLNILRPRALHNWLQQARKQNRLENYLIDKDTGRVRLQSYQWITRQLEQPKQPRR